MNGATKQIWRLLAKEGGRWTVAEVCQKMPIERRVADRAIWAMAEGGSLICYTREDRVNGCCYGVTNACKVPQGVTFGEILELGWALP